jgi:hypothetical protein
VEMSSKWCGKRVSTGSDYAGARKKLRRRTLLSGPAKRAGAAVPATEGLQGAAAGETFGPVDDGPGAPGRAEQGTDP